MSRPWPRWVEYRGVRELRGPLAVVGGVAGVGWDEYVVITLADGSVRHGLVLDVNRDVALVQVMEGASGMDRQGPHTGPWRAAVRPGGNRLAGPHLQWPRRTDRRRPAGDRSTTGAGQRRPAQPDATRGSLEPVLTGVSVIDRADHPGPGSETAGLLVAPGCRTCAWRVRSPRRPVPAASRSAWCSPASDFRTPTWPMPQCARITSRRGIGVAAECRRRPGYRADPHPAHRADHRRASGVRHGAARIGGHDGHDQLRRGAAGNLGSPR